MARLYLRGMRMSHSPLASMLRLALLFLLAGILLVIPPPRIAADPPARQLLERVEQLAVNQAIDRGTAFLNATQGPLGTWAPANESHQVGYAALPGLTLLECGALSTNATVQKAAQFVRAKAPTLENTYELALSILFLDRLGESLDRELIQMLALRLIAGQTTTGGWGYRCQVLKPREQQQLLTTLRQFPRRPPEVFGPVATGSPGSGLPGTPTRPGDPGSPGTIGSTNPPKDPSSPGVIGNPDKPGTPGFIDRSPDSPGTSSPGSTWSGPVALSGSLGLAGRSRCIKMSEDVDPRASRAPDKPDDKKPGSPPRDPAKPPVKVNIPPALRGLPVVHDANLWMHRDAPDRGQEKEGTTDNSNTQFATLALWAARRYDIPMDRTIELLVKRFRTSQNANGSWGYRYRLGGGEGESPQMTCVGLIGLAVGHGQAAELFRGADRARDAMLLNGFVALRNHIGKPAGRMQNLPMPNLYFLWSLERVAVLYDLPAIGDRDWYRWGVEQLVANQQPQGNWDKGGYPGASVTADTCLALLFLKKVNLAEDLASKLPFTPAELISDIKGRFPDESPKPPSPNPGAGPGTPGSPPPTGTPASPTPTPPTPPGPAPGTTPPVNTPPIPQPPGPTTGPRAPETTPPVAETESKGSNKLLIIGLGIAALLLLVLGGVLIVRSRGGEESEPVRPRKARGRGEPPAKRARKASKA
jgi:hypothetical protein